MRTINGGVIIDIVANVEEVRVPEEEGLLATARLMGADPPEGMTGAGNRDVTGHRAMITPMISHCERTELGEVEVQFTVADRWT